MAYQIFHNESINDILSSRGFVEKQALKYPGSFHGYINFRLIYY